MVVKLKSEGAKMRETGTYQILGNLHYFIPHPLPPSNPPLDLNAEIMALHGEASFALGQLNEMSNRLPNANRFIRAYVIKEALLSSAIEGIHTTLIDVFTHPLGESKPNKNTQLVLNYIQALEVALQMLKDQGLPLATRVILAAHHALLSDGEGDKAAPGLLRKQSVRVGNLVPPPASEVPNLMSTLEKYINESSGLPPLIRAGLVHVQFETIHPFLDGNGRIGRLLIVLMLIDSGLLDAPILYPSYYFKKHHLEYYQRLDRVRTQGDFEGWIIYYLKAIRDSSLDACHRAKDIEALKTRLKDMVEHDPQFARIRKTAAVTLDLLFSQPVIGIAGIGRGIEKSYNTAHNIVKQFVALGLLSDDNLPGRSKLYRFEPYLKLLEKEY